MPLQNGTSPKSNVWKMQKWTRLLFIPAAVHVQHTLRPLRHVENSSTAKGNSKGIDEDGQVHKKYYTTITQKKAESNKQKEEKVLM